MAERRAIRAFTAAADRGVDWWFWRVVTDPRIPDGWSDVRAWSFSEMLDAHLVLDALTEAEAAARASHPQPE